MLYHPRWVGVLPTRAGLTAVGSGFIIHTAGSFVLERVTNFKAPLSPEQSGVSRLVSPREPTLCCWPGLLGRRQSVPPDVRVHCPYGSFLRGSGVPAQQALLLGLSPVRGSFFLYVSLYINKFASNFPQVLRERCWRSD